MANNKKFIDAAVGYRPQTAFPLNANEYFESLYEAKRAAAMAAEVGTAEANSTSYYIGQTLAVYEKGRPVVDAPVTGVDQFRHIAADAVGRNIPVVLITLDGSIADPGEDSGSSSLAATLQASDWQSYVESNTNRVYFVYAQKGVDGALWNAVSKPVDGVDPLAAYYSSSDWTDDPAMPYAKVAAVYYDGDNIQKSFSVQPADWETDAALISFIDGIIGGVSRQPNVRMYQIQPDKSLKEIGSDANVEVVVDGETIVQNIDTGALRVKTLPNSAIDGNTIKKTADGKLYLDHVPDSYLKDYVKYDKLSGYVETPGIKRYGIRVGPTGAYVDVPWTEGGGGGGGGGTVSADVIVDNVTIGKKPDGTIYLKSVPDEMVKNDGVLFKDWTVPPLGKIRLLSRDGGWQCYTYSDISVEQGNTGRLAYRADPGGGTYSYILEPFESNEYLSSINPVLVTTPINKVLALDVRDRNIKAINPYGFIRCSNLGFIDCPYILSVFNCAFAQNSGSSELSCVKLSSVEFIDANAFTFCSQLASVECENVQIIGNEAFKECYNISNLNCPNLYVIGNEGFTGCSQLKEINCNNVLSVGHDAFAATSLEEIEWYKATNIGAYAFLNCLYLKSVDFYKLSSTAAAMFENCGSLSSAYLPSVTVIGNMSFENCSSLVEIDSGNITEIGCSAFTNCYKLTGIKSEYITSIANGAFLQCAALSSMNLPSINFIGTNAFENCSSLTSITLSGAWDSASVPAVYSNSFDNIPQTVSVYVMGGMKSTFELNPDWLALEEDETADPEPHKKVKIIELDIGAGSSTTYTDASGNPLASVTILRDAEGAIRDEA